MKKNFSDPTVKNRKLLVRILTNLQYPFEDLPKGGGVVDEILLDFLPYQFTLNAFDSYYDIMTLFRKKGLDLGKMEVHFSAFKTEFIDNLHDKYLVVDGVDTIVGTGNLHPESNNHPDAHLQTGVRIKGLAAKGVMDAFDRQWKLDRTLTWTCDLTKPFSRERCELVATPPIPSRVGYPTPIKGSDKVLVVPSRARLQAGGIKKASIEVDVSPMTEAMVAVIKNARKSIDVESPNISSRDLFSLLKEKARQGVGVRMISDWEKDKVTYEFLDSMFGHGGSNEQVFNEWVPKFNDTIKNDPVAKPIEVRWYSDQEGERIPVNIGPGMNHSKVMIIDKEVLFHGSTNQEFFSWFYSSELNVLLDNQAAVKQALSFFDRNWSIGKTTSQGIKHFETKP